MDFVCCIGEDLARSLWNFSKMLCVNQKLGFCSDCHFWCGKVGSNESIIREALNPNLAFPRRQLCARAYEFHAALSTDLFAQREATCVNTIRTRAGNSVPTHPSCHSINGNVFRVPHHKELFSPPGVEKAHVVVYKQDKKDSIFPRIVIVFRRLQKNHRTTTTKE